MSGDTVVAGGRAPRPWRYFEHVGQHRGPLAPRQIGHRATHLSGQLGLL